MKFAPVIVSIALLPLVVAQEPPRANLVVEDNGASPGEAVSRSGLFRVTGGDGGARGTMALLADQTREELRALTEEKGEEQVVMPIRILLSGNPGEPAPPRPVVMELFFNDQAFDLRVRAHMGRGVGREQFASVLTSALIYERTLRTRKPNESEKEFNVPPWLVEGLREATAWRLKQADRRHYESLFRRGGIYKMDQLFSVTGPAEEQMDTAMKLAFRVSSGALVMALLEQPMGKEGFRAFLTEVAGYQGEMPVLLRKHFPELNLSENSLEKWWALQMANKGAAPLSDSLSIAETEAGLEEALRFHFRSPEGVVTEKPISAWQELSDLQPKERIDAIKPAQDAIWRLSYRSFPSYRPLLVEYQEVLTSMERWETEKVPERLASLEQSRELMRAKGERAVDFLDWFEITRARNPSGVFDDYLRLKERLQERKHVRTDPMSEYLDRMDELFSRGQEERPVRSAQQPLMLPE
ncbi:hypothetical protein OVA24_19105 [Luteolibacter sp. SL250]|uniref:hypothetical protein n=1 Tax=Luteolibacter sp. SL250 TaxID=2995170 RepID=UPI00226F87AE|nr:hypothetical protein [Luteolibacter sp. SL250]WAC19339.1 hypothetical protein OVA24_19105 [Luteolibacter sp. SL250]